MLATNRRMFKLSKKYQKQNDTGDSESVKSKMTPATQKVLNTVQNDTGDSESVKSKMTPATQKVLKAK